METIFREFYYIQMEKFARDAVADERIQCKEDIVVSVVRIVLHCSLYGQS